ncbi:MAG: hypothetical protein NDI91_13855 [Sulfuritalea sp.]|nr:hypothetical protein [Sulfuritalea sp.]
MLKPIEKMHQAVGRAVLWAQTFETVFVICIELVRILRSTRNGERISAMNPNRFKVATRSLIKELAVANQLAPELEDQINDLVAKRHLLVHRWFVENGLPGDSDIEHIAKITDLALEIETSSKRICSLLAGYVSHWGETHPEQQAQMTDEERQRLIGLFKYAHLERDT